MKEKRNHTILQTALVFILAGLLAGCAIYPAVQVAGGAMTGYDAVQLADDYMPRSSIQGGELSACTDKMLERRLRERLKMGNMPMVSAHVIDRQAYLIGQFLDRSRANEAVEIASSIQGLKVINCKFYPIGSPRESKADHQLLAKVSQQLGSSSRLNDADLRVEVIRGNAILIGSAGSWEQKTAAVAIVSEVGGIKDVVDYIVVKQETVPAPDGEKVALK